MEEKVVGKLTLRLKVGLILVLVWVCFGTASYLTHSRILYPPFVDLEHEEARKDVKRITDAIVNEVKHLDIVCKDWAFWDDAYQFAVDRDPEFITSNLPETSFIDNEINLIYFFDAERKKIWGKVFDLEEEKFIPAPRILAKVFLGGEFPERFYTYRQGEEPGWVISGIADTGDKIILLAARPILNSAGEGPRHGILVMGRFLTEAVLDDIREQTHVQFSIMQTSEQVRPERRGSAERNFISAEDISPKGNFSINVQDDLNLSISVDLMNTDNKKSLIIQVDKIAKIIEKGKIVIYTACSHWLYL